MGTDLIPTEHADRGIICPSILPVLIISHLEKIVSVSKMIQRAKKDPKMCLFHIFVCRFSCTDTVLLII